jgi:hypothetical protein
MLRLDRCHPRRSLASSGKTPFCESEGEQNAPTKDRHYTNEGLRNLGDRPCKRLVGSKFISSVAGTQCVRDLTRDAGKLSALLQLAVLSLSYIARALPGREAPVLATAN